MRTAIAAARTAVTTERSTAGPAPAAAAGEILVIHPGALGDVLQAVPALAALRALGGGRRVTLAAQPRIGRLIAGGEAADATVSFDGLGLDALFADGPIPEDLSARLARCERVVSWFGSRTEPYPSRLRAVALGAVVAPPVPDDPVPVWSHLLATVSPLGARAPVPIPPLAVPAAWRAEAERALGTLGIAPGRPTLVVHSGAGGVAKRWPVDKLATVVRRLAGRSAGPSTRRVLVHQGPADAEPAAALVAALARGPRPVPTALLLEPPLETLAAALGGAAAYLGADSGVSHLAAAVGAPALIVFAAGSRARWAPWGPRAAAIDATEDARDVDAAVSRLEVLLADTRALLDMPGAPF